MGEMSLNRIFYDNYGHLFIVFRILIMYMCVTFSSNLDWHVIEQSYRLLLPNISLR